MVRFYQEEEDPGSPSACMGGGGLPWAAIWYPTYESQKKSLLSPEHDESRTGPTSVDEQKSQHVRVHLYSCR